MCWHELARYMGCLKMRPVDGAHTRIWAHKRMRWNIMQYVWVRYSFERASVSSPKWMRCDNTTIHSGRHQFIIPDALLKRQHTPPVTPNKYHWLLSSHSPIGKNERQLITTTHQLNSIVNAAKVAFDQGRVNFQELLPPVEPCHRQRTCFRCHVINPLRSVRCCRNQRVPQLQLIISSCAHRHGSGTCLFVTHWKVNRARTANTQCAMLT